MKKTIVIVLILFLTISIKSYCRKYNQVDEKGVKQGWWISYWDDDKKDICIKNYYKDGLETKICKNYYASGKKRVKFNYNKNRIRVKYFDEKGKLIQKGWAKMNYTDKEIRYFWEGKWTFYDESRNKISESEYLDGHLISERLFQK